MHGAQHRPGAGNFRENNRCRNGHDVTAVGSLVDYKGNQVCRVCLTEARVRWRRNRRQKGAIFDECDRCGRFKYPDNRLHCFACRHELRGERGPTPAKVDRVLTDAILLETAPHWIKADPTEHAAWLAAERYRGLNP